MTYAQRIRQAASERIRELRTFGRTPSRPQYAYRVATTHIVIPRWAREKSLADFTQSYDHIILRSRKLAYRLWQMEAESGGRPQIDRMEIRRCKVCRRWLVGLNAQRRRELDQAAIDGRKLPCDSECYERARGAAA